MINLLRKKTNFIFVCVAGVRALSRLGGNPFTRKSRGNGLQVTQYAVEEQQASCRLHRSGRGEEFVFPELLQPMGDQPETRAMANIGVKRSVSMPIFS
jgi:hypothetical protein